MSGAGPVAVEGVAVVVEDGNANRPLSRRAQQQILVNLLRKLKHSFESANLVLESIMEVKSTYNSLYFERHAFWKALLVFANQVGTYIASTTKRFSAPTRRTTRMKQGEGQKKSCASCIRKAKKIMKSVTKLGKSFALMSTPLRTAYQRLENISQNYWERQGALDNIHRQLETMTPAQMEAATMPDFSWVMNNLYPDHILLKEEWEKLRLPQELEALKDEFKVLQKTNFSKNSSNEDSSSESEDGDEEDDDEMVINIGLNIGIMQHLPTN